jgi:multiple antibiotic resistance protein
MESLPLIEFFIRAFTGVFVILDPLGGSTHFIALTADQSKKNKIKSALRACIVALCVLTFFMLSGRTLFNYFGITLAALKIAGGILLFTVALNMMNAKRAGTKTSPEEEKEAKNLDDIAIIPMAIPLMSGPGAITTVMVMAGEAGSVTRLIILFGSIALAVSIAFLIFANASMLQKVLKHTGIKILTRLMGLIMSVISVQFVINGVTDIMPFLVSKIP